ncbi:hypothetical protein ISS86_02195 [Candidatus Microgenomates bacterium]|nr:hypothetical protein [Candidatus Microgenomates bacterium]
MILNILIPIKEEIGTFFKFTEVEDLGPLLTDIISASISISFILVLIYLIWSGIQWLTSGGEKTAVAAARERMTAAFIGLMIVLSAWAIFILVQYLFGVPTESSEGESGEPTCPYTCLTPEGCAAIHGHEECIYSYTCPEGPNTCCCRP